MAGSTIFTTTYTFIDGKLDATLNSGLSNVIAQVQGPLRVAIALYIILYGIAVLRGAISEPIVDFAIRSLKLCMIVALATTVAYSSNVKDVLFTGLPNNVATAISGSDVANVGGSFDQFFSYGAALSEKTTKGAGIDVGAYIIGGIVFVVTLLAAAFGFVILTIAKVALALLLALGPIFIACALFEPSRRYFFGWLSQCVNYIVLFALMITVFEMILGLMKQLWPSIDGQGNAEIAGMEFSGICALAAIFFLQVPNIAAGIAGSASTGVADFLAAASFVARRPKAAATSAAGAAAAGGGRAAGGSIRPTGAQA